ncbi:MAG: response regulator [Xanthomonadales bacterium]|nr:response regulator [Gammaproteobacteria bacterium]NNK04103.1 response regulator [Xanthomonadales bacterium]
MSAILIGLALVVKNHRWKVLYGILAVLTLTFALLDLLEAMIHKEDFDWLANNWADTIWSVPYLVIVVAARARYFNYPEPVVGVTRLVKEFERPFYLLSPIILMVFILPVLHIVFQQFGLMESNLMQPLGAVVLSSLSIFFLLVVIELRSLRRSGRLEEEYAMENERLRVKQKVADQSEVAKARFLAMDCQMPGTDGIEATRMIRKQGYSPTDLPVIALTAHVFDEDRKLCMDAGMNAFLSKPLSLEQLRDALNTWL